MHNNCRCSEASMGQYKHPPFAVGRTNDGIHKGSTYKMLASEWAGGDIMRSEPDENKNAGKNIKMQENAV